MDRKDSKSSSMNVLSYIQKNVFPNKCVRYEWYLRLVNAKVWCDLRVVTRFGKSRRTSYAC